MIRALCAALLAAGAARAGPLEYGFATPQRTMVASGDVEVAADNSALGPAHGYLPIPVYLTNKVGRPHTVRLAFDGIGPGRGRTVMKVVELAAGEQRTVYLPVPAQMTYGEITVQSDAIRQSGRVYLYSGQVARPQQGMLVVGTAEELERVVGHRPRANPAVQVVTVSRRHAPEELAAYVGWDAVVLPVGLEQCSEAVRRALEAYAATGGSLVVADPGGAAAKLPLLPDGKPGRYAYGFGTVTLCAADASCRGLIEQAVSAVEPAVKPMGPGPRWSRAAYESLQGAMVAMLPQATAPVGRFLFIIVLFALAIGPGSVVVARKRGPSALLLTIPATALITCLLIVGYSVFKEGFRVHLATRGYTLLDARQHRAVTVGVAAYYANVAPAGPRYPSTVAVLSPDGRSGEQRLVGIDWTQGTRFGSDFAPSRTYREWGVVAVEPTRARLSVKREGDGWVVQNALGAHLRAANLRLEGKTFRVLNVPDGGEGRAQAMAMAEPIPLVAVKEYEGRFDARIVSVAKAELAENEFLAQVEGPGPLPMGGVPFSPFDTEHVVRGEVTR